MGWLRRLFPRQRDLAAANNALLAEHELSMVELAPENPLARELAAGIVREIRQGIRGTTTDEYAADFFNNAHRLVQLNMIAHALANSQPPVLMGEDWLAVRAPFLAEYIEGDMLKAVAARLQARHGMTVVVPQKKLRIVDGSLIDLQHQ